MNPIHEAGFASLMLLGLLGVFSSGLALAAVIVAAVGWRRFALVLVYIAGVVGSLTLCAAGLITSQFHHRIDYWISTGSYGPPAAVAAEHGAHWHASAKLTAFVGLVAGLVPIVIALIGWIAARREDPRRWADLRPLLVLAALCTVYCTAYAV